MGEAMPERRQFFDREHVRPEALQAMRLQVVATRSLWQGPKATPETRGWTLLEQHFAGACQHEHDSAFMWQAFAWTGARHRVGCATPEGDAIGMDRARRTGRLRPRAHTGTQIHQALRILGDMAPGQEPFRLTPQPVSDALLARKALHAAVARENPLHVAVEDGLTAAEREDAYRGGRRAPDPGQRGDAL